MSKILIPVKLIIDVSSDSMATAILQYRINEDGNIGKVKSVSVKNSLTSGVNEIIATSKASAEESEGML